MVKKAKTVVMQGYRLDFTGLEEANEVLGIIWTAFTAVYSEYATGYEGLRKMQDIAVKLEAITIQGDGDQQEFSCPNKCGGVIALPANPSNDLDEQSSQQILFTAKERDTLLEVLKDKRIKWSRKAGPRAITAIEWVDGIESAEITDG